MVWLWTIVDSSRAALSVEIMLLEVIYVSSVLHRFSWYYLSP